MSVTDEFVWGCTRDARLRLASCILWYRSIISYPHVSRHSRVATISLPLYRLIPSSLREAPFGWKVDYGKASPSVTWDVIRATGYRSSTLLHLPRDHSLNAFEPLMPPGSSFVWRTRSYMGSWMVPRDPRSVPLVQRINCIDREVVPLDR